MAEVRGATFPLVSLREPRPNGGGGLGLSFSLIDLLPLFPERHQWTLTVIIPTYAIAVKHT